MDTLGSTRQLVLTQLSVGRSFGDGCPGSEGGAARDSPHFWGQIE